MVFRRRPEHGATPYKFIGDCVLAYWLNTSLPARLEALHAARAMQRVAEQVQQAHNETLARVDLAFRLESLTRESGKPVLVSGDFLTSWDAGMALCVPCGSRQVKDRAEPVEVFAAERAPACTPPRDARLHPPTQWFHWIPGREPLRRAPADRTRTHGCGKAGPHVECHRLGPRGLAAPPEIRARNMATLAQGLFTRALELPEAERDAFLNVSSIVNQTAWMWRRWFDAAVGMD